jgi:DNA-binding MarR family transcriptional regulator
MAKYLPMTNERHPEGSTEHVLAAFEEFRKRVDELHIPEFLNIDVTMAQAKILRLLETEGELHMSELVRRLGISLSTLSGHVDRLVQQGLVIRRDDPADRRQVLISPTPAAFELFERFHELNRAQLRRLLETLNRDERLDVVRAFHHMSRAIEASSPATPHERKGPSR